MEGAGTGAVDLPAGVSQPGAAPVPVAPAAGGEPAPAPAPAPVDATVLEEGGSVQAKWYENPMELVAGILIMTLGICAIAFFRIKAFQTDKELKQQEEKLSMIESEVESIKNPNNG